MAHITKRESRLITPKNLHYAHTHNKSRYYTTHPTDIWRKRQKAITAKIHLVVGGGGGPE